MPGFRLGIYVFKDAEIVDFAAPYGVFSVARRFDPTRSSLQTRRGPSRRRRDSQFCPITASATGRPSTHFSYRVGSVPGKRCTTNGCMSTFAPCRTRRC